MSPACLACGEPIVYRGRGRPRKYSEVCVPPGSGGTAWHEAWLREHRDELEAERRRKHEEWMAEWRKGLRQYRQTIERHRKSLERAGRARTAQADGGSAKNL
jgi:hypothetical protein